MFVTSFTGYKVLTLTELSSATADLISVTAVGRNSSNWTIEMSWPGPPLEGSWVLSS